MSDLSIKIKITPDFDVAKVKPLLDKLKASLNKLGEDTKLIDVNQIKQQMTAIDNEISKVGDNAKKMKAAIEDAVPKQVSTSYFDDLSKKKDELTNKIKSMWDVAKQMAREGVKGDTFKNLADAIFGADKELKKLKESALALGGAFQFNQIIQSVHTITGALEQFMGPYREFDKQLRNIGTLGVQNFEEFRDAAINMARSTPDTIAGITEAAYEAISAGAIDVVDGFADVEDGMKFVEKAAKLATAGLSNTSDATKGLAAVTNAYGSEVLGVDEAADVLFSTVKYGVTSIGELNHSLSTAISMAASAKVPFNNIGAAIATLTKQGVPTATAMIQIRGAISELMKPGAQLKKVMDAAGVSMQTLASEGLQATMKRIGESMENMGLDAANTFGSIQAMQFALATTGENAEKAAADLRDLAGDIGSVEGAFAIAQQGIDVKVKAMLNTIQGYAFKVFETIGDGAMVTLSAMNQLAPMIATFTNLKQIIPDNAFAGLKAIDSKSLKSVQQLSDGIRKMIPSIGAIVPAYTAAGAAGTASGTATAAAWMTALAPIVLIVAAIAAVVAFFVLLYNHVEEFRQVVDNAVSLIVLGAERAWEVLKKIIEILYEIGHALFTFAIAPFQILYNVITTFIGNMLSYVGWLGEAVGITAEWGDVLDLVNTIFDYIVKGLEYAIAGIRGFSTALQSVFTSFGNIWGNLLSFNLAGVVEEATNLGTNAGEAFSKGFDSKMEEEEIGLTAGDVFSKNFEQKLNDLIANIEGDIAEGVAINVELNIAESMPKLVQQFEELNKEIPKIEAKMELAKSGKERAELSKQLDEMRLKAQELATQMEQVAPAAVEGMATWVDSAGNLQTTYEINTEKALELAKASAGVYNDNLIAKQDDYSKKVLSISNAYDTQKKQLAELKERIAKASSPREAQRLTEEYAKQKEQVDKTGDALVTAYTEGAKQGLLTAAATKQIEIQLGYAVGTADKLRAAQLRLMQVEEKEEAVVKKTTGHKKTQYEIASRLFDLYKKNLRYETDMYNISVDLERVQSGRVKNIYDEILANEQNIATLEKERAKLFEIFKITEQDGEIEIGMKMKDDDKNKVIEDVRALNLSISRQEISTIELKAKLELEDDKFQEQLEKLRVDRLRFNIEIGIANPQEYVDILEQNLKELQAEKDRLTKVLNEASSEAELKDLRDQLIKKQELILSKEREIYNEKKKITDREEADRKKAHGLEMADLKKRHDTAINMLKARLEFEKELAEIGFATFEKVGDKKYSQIKEEEMAKLESLKEEELISEQEYNNKKLEIEQEYIKKAANLQAIARGQQMAAERLQQKELLEAREKMMQEQLKHIDPELDKEEYDKLAEELTELQEVIAEKGDLLTSYSGELQTTMTDIFSNLFTGDAEDIKAPFREGMAALAGILQQTASAAITKLVLDQLMLTPGGLLAVVAAPAIRAIIGAAVNAILSPIIQGLLSFSTGGRVDRPTLAVIGDGSRSRAGADTEWIFRDDHIWLIVSQALAMQQKTMADVVGKELRKVLSEFSITLHNEERIKNLQEQYNVTRAFAEQSIKTEKHLQELNSMLINFRRTLGNSQADINDILDLVLNLQEQAKLDAKYKANELNASEYFEKYASASRTMQNLAYKSNINITPVGAGISSAAKIMDSNDIYGAIQQISQVDLKIIQNKLDVLISTIKDKNTDIYMDSVKLTDEIQREFNRRRLR